MARRWTIKEENEKRKELASLYESQNKTIGEIGKILGFAESSIFDRLQRLKIPITPRNKPYYLNKKNDGLILPDFSDKFAEFFGIMLGDGHISHGQIWIYINNNTDREYRFYVKGLLKLLFGKDPKEAYRRKQDMVNLFLNSVDLVRYLNEKGLTATNKVKSQANVPSWIFSEDSYKKSFLRGFFDTDGSIYKLKFGVQMCFCNKSLPLLKSARNFLLELGYHPSNISGYNLYLTRKAELSKYIIEIGFGNPKHFARAKKFEVI